MKAILYRNIVILVYVLLLPLVGMGQTYNVSTLAGGTWLDGPALEAKFFQTLGTAVDAAGNVYVADAGNHRIRKIIEDFADYLKNKEEILNELDKLSTMLSEYEILFYSFFYKQSQSN
jgi:hypothetical protein